MRVNLLPAVFSFLLPGLGQVFQRRLAPALLIFAGFTLLSFFAPGRWFLPIVAMASSVEAFLQEQRNPGDGTQPRPRVTLFATVGMIGFLGWMSWVTPVFLPVGNLLEVRDEADKLARYVRNCRKSLGRVPSQLSECSAAPAKDIWGQDFHYDVDARGFVLRSGGRDRQLGNGDDFVFHYRD